MESATKGKAKRRHLSASSCADLGQSRDGSQPLTDPLAVPRSSKDPNRALYPRTPTKRRRRASAGESNQRGIVEFFPITDVVRVSPQKTVTLNGPKHEQERDGEVLTPTEVKEEEDRGGQVLTSTAQVKVKQEDRGGQVLTSIAQVKVKQEPNADEVMCTPKKLHLPIKQEVEEDEEVDYMEGITEDMFGDDDDFEREGLTPSKTNTPHLDRGAGCSKWTSPSSLSSTTAQSAASAAPPRSASRRLHLGHRGDGEEEEEDTAEPLPDPMFGLLGVREGLLEPQGCLLDLPEEVLRQVFSLLPAADLYGSVQYVCRAWRDIIADPQFVPWKKLYYRYLMREPMAVKDLCAILTENCMIKEELSLVNMFRYMSEFKHSKRVDLECVLRSVSTHRLYPQALSCIAYLRTAQSHTLLEAIMGGVPSITGGPSPWCVMAVMLLLADGVGDVLSLVRLLRRTDCLLTPEGVSEYLWAVATLLLAMKDKGEAVCARLHYNVYYVLQMMENSPVTLGTEASPGASNVRVTHEQQVIINHDIQPGQVVKIMAFAGTGKTTTLVQIARMRPHLRFLYVAFNKSVQTHAQRSFPINVHCKTIHSMAFSAVGRRAEPLWPP
ncbi:hypothetical protein ACEWY4_016177 [Coilia grayii]|uniref:F-box DNA helicase 1 n=1 Tax=Coilia grayii TaxID=363190 RepID=A0ABD1JJK3_9TELE